MKQGARTFRNAPVRSTWIQGKRVSRVDNQVIVQLKRDVAQNADAQASVMRELPSNSEVKQDFDETGLAVIALPESANLETVLERLSQQAVVDYAEPNLLDTL
jgi:hypothetical protein